MRGDRKSLGRIHQSKTQDERRQPSQKRENEASITIAQYAEKLIFRQLNHWYLTTMMQFCACIFFLLGLSLVDGSNLRKEEEAEPAEESSRNLIIRGRNASRGRYPWIVRYSYANTLCGGSLIAPDLVLTAAHCFDSDQNLGETQVSRYDLASSSETRFNRNVVERIPHDGYKSSTRFNPRNDIAILKLSSPVNNVDPVKLNFDASFPSSGNDELTMLGWGTSSSTVLVREDILQEAETFYVPFEECAVARDPTTGNLFGYSTSRTVVTNDWLCTQDNDAASCKGDSGGPIINPRSSSSGQDVLVAVISSSVGGCENEYLPQINQRISHHSEWIKEVGCAHSANPPDDWQCTPQLRVIETDAPTSSPTREPTQSPIKATNEPTQNPTKAPQTNDKLQTPNTCAAQFSECQTNTDCCSDRCVRGQCRSAGLPESKLSTKLSGGRGGGGGAPPSRRHVRGR